MRLIRSWRPLSLIAAIGSVLAIALVGAGTLTRGQHASAAPAAPPLPLPPDLPGVSGVLRISTFPDAARRTAASAPHTIAYVDGPAYSGMEDNDLRGYLDGTFKYAWNQTTQSHVRLGRRNSAPRYGEFELFRNLQRWSGIVLPPHATVTRAALTLHVEDGPAQPMRVELYLVRKDWNPGGGGTLQNNVSPPKPGEVWWNEAKHGQLAWGLPGASYAATDTDADTGPMPLAESRYLPGHSTIVFSSPALARYATERIGRREPLLFLVKLTDVQEDIPGTLMEIYSANQGDTRYTARRPHLDLAWSDGHEQTLLDEPIALEYGRALAMQRLPAHPGQWYDVGFVADSGFAAPTIEVRGGTARDTSAWMRVTAPFQSRWDWMQVRLLAAVDPVVLGQTFTSTIHDTWIRTGPPEQQVVPWVFVSPSGIADTVFARYQGHDSWSVAFTPNELGRWRYSWTEHFTEDPYHGADGVFDVVSGTEANVLAQLDHFAAKLRAADRTDTVRAMRLMTQFARLERAAMQYQTPATFRSASGESLHEKLDSIRALWGQRVPDPIPLVPDVPPRWQRDQERRLASQGP
ncbi:MAG TPA: hypothetical protein VF166_03800 [Gemmatimonadaceae bacterium]